MRFTPTMSKEHELGGTWEMYLFENRYGASVIRAGHGTNSFTSSYGADEGLFELAVMICEPGEDPHDYENYGIDYTTPITDDVIGWLTENAVEKLLEKVASLPNVEII